MLSLRCPRSGSTTASIAPGTDSPRIVATAGGEEEEPESRLSIGLPDDFKSLEDVFPGFRVGAHAVFA